ncbi:LacI family DNA-binding transcriptional regulator [Phytoactinopolyspora halotolerans]|uniref:LacI family transcriptional regulator n=1 Tax=Phytoactinopolyspora halotolerans TaxID=1981512 RepID=A0A6L9SCC4_9ACTN|nr:LacI family DNA-binding transcriptional regulator [Phytoactinopolyspora halotolerans]NEE01660.1 LacI family transcriptional regulator [Phytoactinopolyspora halotolerans]
MGARLKDVADRAGVSFKTVSNVINNHPNVTEKTRQKVLQAIAELRYRPNVTARSLRHGRSGFLAIALPELRSPYFAVLASEIGAAAKREGLVVLIEETFGERDGERIALEGLASTLIDGIVFSPMATPARDVAARLDATPMVLLGERAHPAGCDHIAVDNVRAAREVTQHLLDIGRQRIAAIGAERGSVTGGLRARGYRQALTAAGIDVDPALTVSKIGYDRAGGASAMAALLDSGTDIDAVFCFNDLIALGALRVLRERGVRVPEDIAVAGFDDIEDGRYSSPTLTTVSPDIPFLAAEAVRLIVRRLADPDAPATDVEVPFTVQVRESTAGG